MARFSIILSVLALATTRAQLCLSGLDTTFFSLPATIVNITNGHCAVFDATCQASRQFCAPNDTVGTPHRVYTTAADDAAADIIKATYTNAMTCIFDLCTVPFPVTNPAMSSRDLSCWYSTAAGPSSFSGGARPGRRYCTVLEVACSSPSANCSAAEAATGVQRVYGGMSGSSMFSSSELLALVQTSLNFDLCATSNCNNPLNYPAAPTPPQPTTCISGYASGSLQVLSLVNVSSFSSVTNAQRLPLVSFRNGDVCVNYTVSCNGAMDSYTAGCTSNAGSVVKYDVLPSFAAAKWLSANPYVSNLQACTGSAACNAPPTTADYLSRSAAAGPGATACYEATRNKTNEVRGTSQMFSVNETTATTRGITSTGNIMTLVGMAVNPGQCLRVEVPCAPGFQGPAGAVCTASEIAAVVIKVVYTANPFAVDACSLAGNHLLTLALGTAPQNVSCCTTTLCNVAPAGATPPTPSPSPSPSLSASPASSSSVSASPSPAAAISNGASPSTSSSPAPPSPSNTASNLPSSIPVVADYPTSCFVGMPIDAVGTGVALTTLVGPLAVAGNRCIRYRRACTVADVSAGACANVAGMVWMYGVVSKDVCSRAAQGDAATTLVYNSATCCSTAACNTIISNAASPSPAPSSIPATAVAIMNATLQFAPGSVDVAALSSSTAARAVLRATISATLGVSAANVTITAIRNATGAAIPLPAGGRRLQGSGPAVDFTVAASSFAAAADLSSNIVAPSFASTLSLGLRNAVASSTDAALVSSFRGASVSTVTGVTVGIAANIAATAPPSGSNSGSSSSSSNVGVIVPAVVVPCVVVVLLIGAAIMYRRRGTHDKNARPLTSKSPSSSSGVSV